MKALLLLNNLYIYADGRDLVIGNKINYTGDVTQINKTIGYNESGLIIGQKDFDSDVDILFDSTTVSRFLETYYNSIGINGVVQIIFETPKVTELNLLDIIMVYGITYVIAKINLDNDGFLYRITAWRL